MVCNESIKQGGIRLSIITLLSGGIDSCLMSVLTLETGREQKPLFINYGQLNCEREYKSVMAHADQFCLQKPTVIDVSGYGKTITSYIFYDILMKMLYWTDFKLRTPYSSIHRISVGYRAAGSPPNWENHPFQKWCHVLL